MAYAGLYEIGDKASYMKINLISMLFVLKGPRPQIMKCYELKIGVI